VNDSNDFDGLQGELHGWRRQLHLTPTKQPRPLLTNAAIAFRLAPEWQGVLGYNEFALTVVTLRPPPWRKAEDNSWNPTPWTDDDDVSAAIWLQNEGIAVSEQVAHLAAKKVAKESTFHPVRDYLNGLVWDGTPRVESLAEKYFGAEKSDYHRAVSRCMLIAAVARIMIPGCKHDHMPILEGEQDKGKSTAIRLLFEPWFTDDLSELGTKDAAMQLRSAWGVEVGELAAMTRAEIERIKAFVTRRTDRFRPPYGRSVIEAPRQSVFVGSTNADTYLKDETGGRRFWPLKCGDIDLAAIERDRDQLWAEAVALFKADTPWWLTGSVSRMQAEEEQASRYQTDPWQKEIDEYLETREDTSIHDIFVNILAMPEKARWDQAAMNRIARCLRHIGFERYQKREGGGREWRYRRKDR
jgi:predicted P-loop ATPase